MGKNIICIGLLLCSFFAHGVFAQDVKKEFMSVVKGISNYQQYSLVNAMYMKEGGKITDSLVTKVMVDRVNRRVFYENRVQTLVFESKFYFEAQHVNETVSVFNVAVYKKNRGSKMLDFDAMFENNMMLQMMDSNFLSKSVVKRSVKGHITTYYLSFPEEANYLLTLAYDTKTQLPVVFEMEMKDAASKEYVYKLSGYKKSVDGLVFDLSRYFSVAGGKVVLNKYKNYKITSIL